MADVNIEIAHHLTNFPDDGGPRRLDAKYGAGLHNAISGCMQAVDPVSRHAVFQPVSFDKQRIPGVLVLDDPAASILVARDLDTEQELLQLFQPNKWIRRRQGFLGLFEVPFTGRVHVHVDVNDRVGVGVGVADGQILGFEEPMRLDYRYHCIQPEMMEV